MVSTARSLQLPGPSPLTVVSGEGPLRVHVPLGDVTGPRHGGRELARDVVADFSARVAFLGLPGATLCLAGAAWVHAGNASGPVPARVEHTALPGDRRDDLPRMVRLTEDEIQRVGGFAVTTPLRTALDIARLLPASEALYWLLVLAEAGEPLDAWRADPRLRLNGGSWPRGASVLAAAARAWRTAQHRDRSDDRLTEQRGGPRAVAPAADLAWVSPRGGASRP